ncbi:hypothetical protein Rin_00015340 [Candidatus Regiella insecticola 5.15]|uniref:Uncharacterized protein n=1 Tax=Candidatus Regiella insecticola 5.15 TaxID=1005043 RepID=G2H0F6_9ENTR|nr:hypothetical protein [Candidatus Regiella insecticola]EGY28520.1 hypothetical protein Rin_00015340 [Candidatus Regiella insecticola 5.15]
MMREGKQHIAHADREINSAKEGINSDQKDRGSTHRQAEQKFDKDYDNATEDQRLPWVASQDALTQRALEIQKKIKGGRQ